MKKSRHTAILSIISERNIETQEELADLLKQAGFTATQATVSRDIRELTLTKVTDENGKQKYISLAGVGLLPSSGASYRLLKESMISVECAGNLLVVKTRSGMGMAVAVNIDEMSIPEIVGTIGSDDVVFCAVKTAELAEKFRLNLLSIAGIN